METVYLVDLPGAIKAFKEVYGNQSLLGIGENPNNLRGAILPRQLELAAFIAGYLQIPLIIDPKRLPRERHTGSTNISLEGLVNYEGSLTDKNFIKSKIEDGPYSNLRVPIITDRTQEVRKQLGRIMSAYQHGINARLR